MYGSFVEQGDSDVLDQMLLTLLNGTLLTLLGDMQVSTDALEGGP